MNPTVAIAGMGRVGTALASLLEAAGARVVRLTRSTASSRSALAYTELEDSEPPGAVVLCVPDGAIQSALRRFPASWQTNPDLVWLHTSGVLPGEVLRPLAAGPVGSMHPLAPFPPVGAAPPCLAGVAFAVDGDEAALAAARSLVALLGGVPVPVAPEARVAWHLAAVLASNGVYALLEAAETVLREASLDPDLVLPSLARLAESSAHAAGTLGHVVGATGPVVRGDANTVAMHRAWIARRTPPLDPLYRELGDRLVSIAERAGSPVSSTARVLAALHGDQPGAPDASGGES